MQKKKVKVIAPPYFVSSQFRIVIHRMFSILNLVCFSLNRRLDHSLLAFFPTASNKTWKEIHVCFIYSNFGRMQRF